MPFVLLMLGVVTLAVALGSRKSDDGAAPARGRTYTLDSSMPPALRDQVLAALAGERNPAVLETFGNALQFQYPLAAAALRQRANELRALGGQPPPQALPVPTPAQPPAPLPVPVPVVPAPTPAPAPVPVPRVPLDPLPPAPIPVPPSVPVPQPAVLPGAVPALPMGLDPGMPPEVAQAVTTALATETDPEKLRAFASTLSPKFPIAAGLLIAKANALALVQPPRPSVVPPAPSAPPIPIPVGPPSASNPLFATVATNDPPPAGDLKVFDAINGKQIGGAEKNGTVAILTWNADGQNQWAKVAWPGGSRWKAVTGFVHQAFLRPSASPPSLPASLQVPQLIMSANQPFPAAAPPATYVVKPGDFPIKIAQKLTGDGNRWKELIAANPSKKVAPNGTFATLLPGEILNLPASWSKGVTNAAHA